ncbi:MAG TPA: twin-arginine translocase subunit TatC [Steroidobacteraceae bacterium]|nr:twin-arginine translocase subunit TatC [Steroidobacteraceae bacterium]
MAEEPEKEELAEGTLISHLLELRNRLMRAMIAVIIVLIPCIYWQNTLFTFVSKPIREKLPKGATLIATGVMSPFFTPMKLAMFVSVFIAMPYILYQVWAFVAPGLYKQEKKFAIPLLVSSVFLFYLGVGFAYEFVFPTIFGYFAGATPQGVTWMADITQYLDFAMQMFFGFGLAFEVPIAVVLLVITGIVPLQKLKANRGYVLVGVFVVSAMVTPPDALSQCSMAIPMYLLYEGGLVMAAVMYNMRKKEAARRESDASGVS